MSKVALFVLLLITPLVVAAQVKLEPAGPLKDPAASPEIIKAVAPEGQRVVLRNGEALCDIWLVNSLPALPSQGQSAEHTNYSGALAPGEFAGVISFPHGAKDFRGQPIQAGAYSLRYELMPNDGNHMGVAPERDFLLLVPLAKETSTATMTSGALLIASSAASGTSHPAVFLLLAESKAPLPRVYEVPEGYLVFAGKAGNLSLALVVKGQAEQ